RSPTIELSSKRGSDFLIYTDVSTPIDKRFNIDGVNIFGQKTAVPRKLITASEHRGQSNTNQRPPRRFSQISGYVCHAAIPPLRYSKVDPEYKPFAAPFYRSAAPQSWDQPVLPPRSVSESYRREP